MTNDMEKKDPQGNQSGEGSQRGQTQKPGQGQQTNQPGQYQQQKKTNVGHNEADTDENEEVKNDRQRRAS